MPKVALADTMADWESLLAAAEEKLPEVPDLGRHIEDLRAALAETHRLDHLRQKLQADLQTATQDLVGTRAEGEGVAARIRWVVRVAYGPHWEGLVQFKIRPRRSRRHRAVPVASATASTVPNES
jgi:hypothetical protein